MYQANEEAEDGHALRLAILVIVLTAVGFSLWLHTDTAIKYWLLNRYGATSQAIVVAVHRPNSPEDLFQRARSATRNQKNALKNRETWLFGDAVALSFRDEYGTVHRVGFLLQRSLDGTPISETFTIAYLPQRPGIAYPLEHLEDLNFDARVAFWSVVIGVFALILLFGAIRRWREFRSKARFY